MEPRLRVEGLMGGFHEGCEQQTPWPIDDLVAKRRGCEQERARKPPACDRCRSRPVLQDRGLMALDHQQCKWRESSGFLRHAQLSPNALHGARD
jgi:hypothetical protein